MTNTNIIYIHELLSNSSVSANLGSRPLHLHLQPVALNWTQAAGNWNPTVAKSLFKHVM